MAWGKGAIMLPLPLVPPSSGGKFFGHFISRVWVHGFLPAKESVVLIAVYATQTNNINILGYVFLVIFAGDYETTSCCLRFFWPKRQLAPVPRL